MNDQITAHSDVYVNYRALDLTETPDPWWCPSPLSFSQNFKLRNLLKSAPNCSGCSGLFFFLAPSGECTVRTQRGWVWTGLEKNCGHWWARGHMKDETENWDVIKDQRWCLGQIQELPFPSSWRKGWKAYQVLFLELCSGAPSSMSAFFNHDLIHWNLLIFQATLAAGS